MLLDIGAGIVLAIFTSKLFAAKLSLLFLAAGIVFTLMMDFDGLVNLIKNRGTSQSYKHRDLFHVPLIYIPIGVIVFSFIGPAWAVLFGLCSVAHFLHDSIGIGWGVKWLYPFSNDQYSFFYQYNAHRYGHFPTRLVYVWKHDTIDELERKYGDGLQWFRNIYLRFHWYGLAEFAVFAVALVALYLSFH